MTFLGMTITGDLTRGGDRKAQRSEEEFQAIVRAVINSQGVSEFSWRQYTPYFNDGEPCTFGCYGLGTLTVEGYEFDEWGYDGDCCEPGTFDRVVGVQPSKWRYNENKEWVEALTGPYVGPDESRYTALTALNSALESGTFDDVLLKLFGDHADVKVVVGDGESDGRIEVEFYEHD